MPHVEPGFTSVMYPSYITPDGCSMLPLKGQLTLGRGPAGKVGGARVALLEAIGAEGSIRAAAERVGLSYKGAWDAVQALNNLFAKPLVLAAAGGTGGGAARLTPEGEAAIEAFHALEGELARALTQIEARLSGGRPLAGLELFWSLAMQTSARNALRGVVESITDGAVNAEVTLRLGDGQEMVAMITRESLAELRLAPGRPAIALVNPTDIVIARDLGATRTSARNVLTGTIVRREDGAVNSEISLDLGEGKILVAILTIRSAAELGLEVGTPASALIKAPHVILLARPED